MTHWHTPNERGVCKKCGKDMPYCAETLEAFIKNLFANDPIVQAIVDSPLTKAYLKSRSKRLRINRPRKSK